MTVPRRSDRGPVPWLMAQAVVFGVMAALLGIVANAIFLDAYGAEWLPATYIAIGLAGIVVSGAVARAARSADLVPIALVVLGGAAAGIGVSWAIAAGGDGAWVSVPLLVLFPVLIQLGFVFIGGQGGRLLDIAGIKASFPRIMAGFPAGAVLGGLLGAWLISQLGRTEDLLLATALVQGMFAALVWATGRRYAARLRSSGDDPAPEATEGSTAHDRDVRPSMRELLTRPFVALILAYQVLSALASQLADYLVFDRANARFADPAELAGFLAVYTAVMNAVSIGFLFLVAGPLLRRYGLRLGIAANPLVLSVFAAGMVVAFLATGGGSVALLVVVAAARIADIVLTDGTTRTSINATYQVLPERERLSIQAAVEGIGVPVAIGISGVLILALNALPFALAATIAVTTIICVIWTWSAILLYRAYGPALVDALRRRRVLDDDAPLEPTEADEASARHLLVSADLRAARLGLDLAGRMSSPALRTELAGLADDPRADVRMTAIVGLAMAGDEDARRRLAESVRAAATSDVPADRRRVARALEVLDVGDRAAAADLLVDPDATVRAAALGAVQAGDAFAVGAVLDALADPSVLGAASGAVERLGDAVVPALAEMLDASGSPAPPRVLRLVRAAATGTPLRDEVLRRHIGHRDRELGLVVMERLGAPGPAPVESSAALDAILLEDTRHAARILAAITAFEGPSAAGAALETDGPVRGALEDELALIRQRVIAGRVARHGTERLGAPLTELAAGGPGSSLAIEAIEVALSAAEAAVLLALAAPRLSVAERLARLGVMDDGPTDIDGWLRDLIEDVADRWRAPWLRACAIHAARARTLLTRVDLSRARALRDPVVDEELGLPSTDVA